MAEDIKIRAVKAHPLSLVMNDGTIPSSDGVVYKFRSGYTEYKDFWLWEVEGYDNVAFYVFSPYPDDSVFEDIKDIYAGEDWFDPDEMDMALREGYDVNKVEIWAEKNYKLPYQEITLENGHIYAHDEETGAYRELVKVTASYDGVDGCSFYIFARGVPENYNYAMFSNLLDMADCKVPENAKDSWRMFIHGIMAKKGNLGDIKIRTENVFVLGCV